jgi:hypothetical protein
VIVYVATDVPSVLDHRTKNFGTELVMSERHEANDVIPFANVDVKFVEQHAIG